MYEKQLPQNIEAEQAVLGSLIIDPAAIALVADRLSSSDFYRSVHKDIYEAMLYLYERRTPADYITLCSVLEYQEKYCEEGWSFYLDRLTDDVPTSSHAEHYAKIVVAASEQRQLIHAAGQIAAEAYEEHPDSLEKAERLIYSIGQRRHSGDFEASSSIMSAYLHDLDIAHGDRGKVLGIPTGLKRLDSMLGGLQRSDLIILAARPSIGKTSLALTIANNAAIMFKKRVGIASLETSKRQLAQRLVALTAPMDLQKLRTAWIEEKEWDRIVNAVDALSEGKLWIADTTGLSIASLRSKCLRLQAQHGLDLLIVDYLQLMIGPDPKAHANRVQEISDISRGLKLLAVELDIPILALSQLNRDVEKRPSKIPQLSDLRDSGSLEQDADVVLFIYRDEYYNHKSERAGIADIIIAKHRNGPVGEIELGFELKQTRFYNRAEMEVQA
jgi:replicative DNA helicase